MVQSYYDKRIVGCPGGEGGKPLSLTLFNYYFPFIYFLQLINLHPIKFLIILVALLFIYLFFVCRG